MEVTHVREENKKITKQMSDLRGKLADMEARVRTSYTNTGFIKIDMLFKSKVHLPLQCYIVFDCF